MAARRRNQLPPYEIMRRQDRTGHAQRAEDEADGEVSWLNSLGETLRSWWPRTQEPLVLHVPKGLAVAVLAGILGLIVLSYSVGHIRANSAAAARHEAYVNNQKNLYRPRVAPPQRDLVQARPQQPTTPEREIRVQRLATGNKRKHGMNYLVLWTATLPEAQRLIQFLEPYAVAAAAFSTDNSQLVEVWALRPFPGHEKGSKAWTEHQQKLRKYGREWKRHNDGKGSDLADMYYRLYQDN